MILKLKIKPDKKTKKKNITIWVQKHEDFDEDIQQLFQFFKDQIIIKRRRKIYKYYKITSDNPAIMMSLFSAAHELIPEIYFNDTEPGGLEETIVS